MIRAADHDDLVARVYASAVGETPWNETLEKMASVFGCTATLLGIHRPNAMQVMAVESHNYDKSLLVDYFASEIYAHDPRMPIVDQVPVGQVYHDEMLYDPNEMERRSPWVRASLDALGVFDLMGAKFDLGADGHAMRFALMRTRREGRVGADAVAAFRRLAPQVQHACALGHLLENQAASHAAMMEAVASKAEGIVLIDTWGRVVFVNAAAERLLSAGDGLALRGSEFVTGRLPETHRLRRLIGETVEQAHAPGSAPGGRVLVSRPSRRRPYVVHAGPAPRREAFLSLRTLACVVRIVDLDAQPQPGRDALTAVFGLTERETDLALALVRTSRLEVAAAQCGMALNTARNHLQALFAKTGAHSQAEAVQLLGRLA